MQVDACCDSIGEGVLFAPSGGTIGIGCAIPSNLAKAVMDQLLKTGKVRRGLLGVTIQSDVKSAWTKARQAVDARSGSQAPAISSSLRS